MTDEIQGYKIGDTVQIDLARCFPDSGLTGIDTLQIVDTEINAEGIELITFAWVSHRQYN